MLPEGRFVALADIGTHLALDDDLAIGQAAAAEQRWRASHPQVLTTRMYSPPACISYPHASPNPHSVSRVCATSTPLITCLPPAACCIICMSFYPDQILAKL